MCSEEMGEKDKQNGSHAVERGRMHEAKEMRHRLIRVDSLPPRDMVKDGPTLLLRSCLGPWSHRSPGLY